jgi:hypothetical protein
VTIRRVVELTAPISSFTGKTEAQVRRAMAFSVFERLQTMGALPQGTTYATALPDAMRTDFATAQGLKPDAAPATWGQALELLCRDADGDGRLDLDPAALAPLGLPSLWPDALPQTAPSSDRFEADLAGVVAADRPDLGLAGTLQLGAQDTSDGKQGVDLAAGNADRTVTMWKNPDGSLVGPNDTPQAGAQQVQIDAHLDALGYAASGKVTLRLSVLSAGPDGDTQEASLYEAHVSPRGNNDSPSLSAPTADWITGQLLGNQAPPSGANAELALFESMRKAQHDLVLGSKPSDPAKRTVWAAGRLTPDQVATKVKDLTARYGVAPKRWLGYVDDVREVQVAKAFRDAALPAKGITPAFLYTIAIGEGAGFFLDFATQGDHVALEQPVSGFQYLGCDTFGSRVADLKRKGLVPADFQEGRDYTLATAQNELGQSVTSADFTSFPKGLTALAALLADMRGRFLSDAKSVLGPQKAAKLTEEQINFFTYFYFNAGEGAGKRLLVSKGLAPAAPWSGPPPPNNMNARFNSLQRLATWRMVSDFGLFS